MDNPVHVKVLIWHPIMMSWLEHSIKSYSLILVRFGMFKHPPKR